MIPLFRYYFYPVRQFVYRIKNVWRWLPIIWKDKDYDHHFISEILIKKLEHTRDFFLSDDTHIAEASQVAAQIQEAINRLHMTRDSWEFYEDPAMEQLEQKWGKTTFEHIPYQHTKDGKVLSYELKSKTEKVITEEDEEQYKEEFRKTLKDVRKKYIKDKIAAYEFIGRNMDTWWD
jgi:hypothetical protein